MQEESEIAAKNVKQVVHDMEGLKNETKGIGERSQKIFREVEVLKKETGQRTEALARDVKSLKVLTHVHDCGIF